MLDARESNNIFCLFSGWLLLLLCTTQAVRAQTQPDSSASASASASASISSATASTNNIPSELASGQAFLLTSSSYVILTESLRLSPNALVGFSFRTCHAAGELLRQIGLNQAGLEKTRVFKKKTQPSVFFWFYLVLVLIECISYYFFI
jgi:hypothetical protein